MRRLAGLYALLTFMASVAGCTLNWDPLQPGICGGSGQACCADGGVACQSGLACVSGMCGLPCAGAMVSCGGTCTDISSNNANCGGCGRACAAGQECSSGICVTQCLAGQTLCSGVCVDLATSATSCGACGNSCESSIPHAGATCTSGVCHFVACVAGFGDCDANPANGCETNLSATATHCGTCSNACPAAGPNQIATCSSGVCGTSCAAGFADCNAMASDGCEVQTATDAMHCGSCSTVCSGGANATAACTGGSCTLVCAANFADCDHIASTGCEVDLQTSDLNCGACAARCTGMRTCNAGSCH